MAEEYGPEAGPDADPIGVQTQDGVQIGNNFYNFRNIPINQLIEMMGDPMIKDLPIDWSQTAYPQMEQRLEDPSFSEMRLSQLSNYTGIFGTNNPFLIELDIPWEQTQWAGIEEKFDDGELVDLRFSEIDEDPPIVVDGESRFAETRDRLDELLSRLEQQDPPGAPEPGTPDPVPYEPGESNRVTADALYELLRGKGFTQSQAVTMVAIARAESGFDARATNMEGLDRSYGLFQINMIGNLGESREQIYSTEEFRRDNNLPGEWQGYETLLDPQWNIAAAKQVYDEARVIGIYDNRGFADPGFGPWSVYTSGVYEQYLNLGEEARDRSIRDGDGSAPPSPPGTGEDITDDGMPEFDDEVYQFLNDQFGAGMYFFMQHRDGMRIGILPDGTATSYNDPDAIDLVDLATYIAGGTEYSPEIVSEQRILALFAQTQWWQTTDVAMREFDLAWDGMSDPEKLEYLEPTIGLLEDRAQFLGIPINNEELYELAKTIKRFGDSDNAEAINAAMFAYSENLGMRDDVSAYEQSKDELKKMANSYYVPIGDSALENYAGQLFVESANEGGYQRVMDEYEQFLKQAAVSRFPTLDRAINELGVTPETFFAPYKYQIEQMLERPNIDMVEEFADVIEYIPEGGMEARPMTLGEVRKFVRALPEWQQTGNAKDQARALAFAIGKTFGEVA